MSIFGSELIPTGKYVAHHPEAGRITTTEADSIEEAVRLAYLEDDEWEFEDGRQIAISMMHEWMPTVDDGDRLIEDLQEVAYEAAGEISDDFLKHVSPEHRAALAQRVQDVVRNWIKEIYLGAPPFWLAGETIYQTVQLPPEIAAKREPDPPLTPIPLYKP